MAWESQLLDMFVKKVGKFKKKKKFLPFKKYCCRGLKYAVLIIHRFWKRSFPQVCNSFSSIFELGSMNFSEKTAKDISLSLQLSKLNDFPLKDTKVLQF